MPPTTAHIAALQMDASPAPTSDRLARAENLTLQAAQAGAQLIVLPELFNTGYIYSEENFQRAETLDGETATWLRSTASRLGIHLAGSMLLVDGEDIYNALLLFAPDGRMWRYDKNYPWGWERGYFRGSQEITIADTDLGSIGMMLCWDCAHLDLWRRYAGKIDLMLVASCPPDVTNPIYRTPDGKLFNLDDLGPLMRSLKDSARLIFNEMQRQQTAWLGIPTVNTVGCGQVVTHVPNAGASLLSIVLMAPKMLRYLPQADQIELICDLTPGCHILDSDGEILASLSQDRGENICHASVQLKNGRPQPNGKQPASLVPHLSYWIADRILPWLSRPVYRQGIKKVIRIE